MATRNLTQYKKDRFLKSFEELGNISKAAQLAGINRREHYFWINGDPEYAKAFENSEKIAADTLESEGYRRALEGVDEPVVYQGNFTYPLDKNGIPDKSKSPISIRKYSDTLLIFLLKGARPDKYKDRHELGGPGGGPITLKVVYEIKDDLNGEALA